MTLLLVAAIAMLAAALGLLGHTARRMRGQRRTAAPTTHRILFPFTAEGLSSRALDAALRLAAAEHATLVPVFLARVSLTLPLETPLPRQCGDAVPMLETIEQRAAAFGVTVDTRIERGRDYRHALRRVIEHERYDRLVVAAVPGADGFHTEEMAWLLDHAPGEIVILRPAGDAAAPVRRRPAYAATVSSAVSTGTWGTPTASATGA